MLLFISNFERLKIFTVSFFALLYVGFFFSLFLNPVFALFWLFILTVFYFRDRVNRKPFRIIFFSGFIFIFLGEIIFRLHYFGVDALLYFKQYTPASMSNFVFSGLEYDTGSYTGLKPGQKGIFMGVPIQINSQSFYGEETAFEKPEGVYRVVIVGTSFSQGAGVKSDQNYGAFLERFLEQRGCQQNVEVINLSRGWNETDDLIDVLNKFAMQYKPDLILYERNPWESTGRHTFIPPSRTLPFFITCLYPEQFLFFWKAVDRELIPFLKAKIKEWSVGIRENFLGPPPLPVTELDFDSGQAARYLNEIKKITAGTRTLIVFLRRMRFFSKKIAVSNEEKKMIKEFGFDFVDTHDAFYGYGEDDMMIFLGDRHPNARAHRIFAEEIYAKIKDLTGCYN